MKPRLTPCRTCGLPIWWLETLNGRPMPLDPRPHPSGNVIVGTRSVPESLALDAVRPVARHAVVLGASAPLPAGWPEDTPRWMPHWATCARRPRRKNERGCAAVGCGRLVDGEYLMCGGHWRQVPPMLRATIQDLRGALRRGETSRRREYQVARRAAIACVLEAESARAQRSLLNPAPVPSHA